MKKIRFCKTGAHYTLREECHGATTGNPLPPKFDPKDRYGELRRKAKGIS